MRAPISPTLLRLLRIEAFPADRSGLPPATDDARLSPSTLFAALEVVSLNKAVGSCSFDLFAPDFCGLVSSSAGGGACACRREVVEGGCGLCPPWDAVDEVELEGLRESFAREY